VGNKVSPKAVIAPLAPRRRNNTKIKKKSCLAFRLINIFFGSPSRIHSNNKVLLPNNKNVFTRCNAITIARVNEEFSPVSSNKTNPAPMSASKIIKIKTKSAAFLTLDFFSYIRKTHKNKIRTKMIVNPLVIR